MCENCHLNYRNLGTELSFSGFQGTKLNIRKTKKKKSQFAMHYMYIFRERIAVTGGFQDLRVMDKPLSSLG